MEIKITIKPEIEQQVINGILNYFPMPQVVVNERTEEVDKVKKKFFDYGPQFTPEEWVRQKLIHYLVKKAEQGIAIAAMDPIKINKAMIL